MATATWQTATAQDATADSTYRQFNLGEVVVTGTRTPKFLKNTPIQTRVISAKELPGSTPPTCRTSCNRNCPAWSSRMP